MKLSDLKCRKAKAEEKLLKLSDGEGLFLHVYPNGKKLWRLSYRHAGKQQVTDITPRDVLRVLRVIEAKGNRETARRMRGVLSSVFRLAVIEDVIQNDPSAPLKGVLLPPETRHNSAVTEPEAFGALLRAIDGYDGHKTIKIALQLLALTFPLRIATDFACIATKMRAFVAISVAIVVIWRICRKISDCDKCQLEFPPTPCAPS